MRIEVSMEKMMRAAVVGLAVVVSSAVVNAHVTVVPRESTGSATERYTVRAPTEGEVATVSVELEVPSEVTVTDVVTGSGYTFETRRDGDRIVAITWKQDIRPGGRGEFVFVARNPASGKIAWKARQHFADGTSTDWIGVEGDRRPASMTTLKGAP